MDIRVPALGEGADSGTVITIYVKAGDEIKKDQPIVDLENEKAVAAIPATAAGKVTKIYVKIGDKVSVGQALVALDAAGALSEPSAPKSAPLRESSVTQPRGEYRYESKSGFPAPASPSVRKFAESIGLDLGRVRGSGHGGRITLEDVQAHMKNLQEVGATRRVAPTEIKHPESIDFSKWGKIKKEKISSLRKTVGGRMTESWTTIPHVTQFDEADITDLMALRKKYAAAYEKKGTKLTLTSFALAAAAQALKKYPQFNASLDEAAGEIVYKEYCHLGVAVDTPAGLIVPVLRDADKKNLLEISTALEALAEKTRQRKIGLEELKGGTFTISNLGGIGGAHFTPIVNKPEVAILGLGRGAEKPLYKEGKLERRLALPVALSYDHRVIDGADGARFIRAFCQALEGFKEKDVKI